MTQEDKELLLKDICARLPYGVKIHCNEDIIMTLRQIDKDCFCECWENEDFICHSRWMIPYLRTMSSMTEAERMEFEFLGWRVDELDFNNPWTPNGEIENVLKGINWLNAHHFDYRGLLERGLAIKITKENNPYEN